MKNPRNGRRLFTVVREGHSYGGATLHLVPLQSIELTARLLGTDNLTSAEGSKHLERSLIQLRELSKILSIYEQDVDWTRTGSSFDAVAMLQKKLVEVTTSKNVLL